MVGTVVKVLATRDVHQQRRTNKIKYEFLSHSFEVMGATAEDDPRARAMAKDGHEYEC